MMIRLNTTLGCCIWKKKSFQNNLVVSCRISLADWFLKRCFLYFGIPFLVIFVPVFKTLGWIAMTYIETDYICKNDTVMFNKKGVKE